MVKKIWISTLFFYSLGIQAQWDWTGGTAKRDTTSALLDIGNNDEYKGYELLDTALEKYSLFLAGENYSYTSFNAKIEFKLLRYMNYKVGLRNYILETSAAKADLVNQYINAEDSSVEKLLQSVSKVKYMRLYKNLKRLNAKLPDSMRIRVFGIDVERSSALPLVKMSQCFSGDTVPDDLRIAVEAIHGAAKYIISRGLEEYERERDGVTQSDEGYFYTPSAFSVKMSVEEFMKTYDSLQPRFQSWLGNRYAAFDEAIGWLREYKNWGKYRRTAFEYTWREEVMYQRLNSLLKAHEGEKFFGQLGSCRTVNQRVPEGCGAYSFSGLLHKLRNSPESHGKNAVNIGIYYAAEFNKSERRVNKQHLQYQTELEELFAAAPQYSTTLVNPAWIAGTDGLKKEFNYLILNNNFLLQEDEAEEDTTSSAVADDTYSYENSDYRNSRLYLGINWYHSYVDLTNLNNELQSAGMGQVKDLSYAGAELSMALEDKSVIRFYGGTNVSNSRNYSGGIFFLEGGQAFLFKKWIKMGLYSSMGYIQHNITEYSGSSSSTYFVNYESPKVYKNPAFILGLSADMYIDLAPFYVFFSSGRQWDLGKSAWRLDGRTTGSRGGISNTAWTTNLGFGFSVPLHWID